MQAILQIRSEIKDKDKNARGAATGSAIAFVSPQINYKLFDVNIAASYDYPFYKNYYGRQLAINDAFSVNLSYQFDTATIFE